MGNERWAFNYVSPDALQAAIFVSDTLEEARQERKVLLEGSPKGQLVSKIFSFNKGMELWVVEGDLHAGGVLELAFQTKSEAMRWRKRLKKRVGWMSTPEKKKVIR